MLKEHSKRSPGHFSDYFAQADGALMAMTLEFPYASPGKNMSPAACRRYGELLLAAWNRCSFDGERTRR